MDKDLELAAASALKRMASKLSIVKEDTFTCFTFNDELIKDDKTFEKPKVKIANELLYKIVESEEEPTEVIKKYLEVVEQIFFVNSSFMDNVHDIAGPLSVILFLIAVVYLRMKHIEDIRYQNQRKK